MGPVWPLPSWGLEETGAKGEFRVWELEAGLEVLWAFKEPKGAKRNQAVSRGRARSLPLLFHTLPSVLSVPI